MQSSSTTRPHASAPPPAHATRMHGNGCHPSPRRDRTQRLTGNSRHGERRHPLDKEKENGLNSDWVLQMRSSRVVADLSERFPLRSRHGRPAPIRPRGPFERHRYGRCIEVRRQEQPPSQNSVRASASRDTRSLPRASLYPGSESRFTAAREMIGSMPSSSRYEATSSISAARRGP